MTIGERIKELRKKNDLTQEKLADYLCVSYQAVSKWECGVSSPDLALIVPLTKILNVSADELFGLNEKEEDLRETELEEAYNATFKNGDLNERLNISSIAIKEYPGNMNWLNRYAWDIWCIAVVEPNNEIYNEQREKAIKIFETVIENCDDDGIKCHAITGIVQCLSGTDKEKAKRYVDLFPETKIRPEEKDHLLALCLTGEERIEQKQKILEGKFEGLIEYLMWNFDGIYSPDKTARRNAETMIELMIPDGNYQSYHHYLFNIKLRDAIGEATDGNADNAIALLKEAIEHAKAYDDLEFHNPREYSFTSPLFDRLKYDSRKWFRTGVTTLTDDLKQDWFLRPFFDSLREREDFKELTNI